MNFYIIFFFIKPIPFVPTPTQNFTRNHSVHKHGPEVEAHHGRLGRHKEIHKWHSALKPNVTYMYRKPSMSAWRWKACTSSQRFLKSGRGNMISHLKRKKKPTQSRKLISREQVSCMLRCKSLKFLTFFKNHTQDFVEAFWDNELHYTQLAKILQSYLCQSAGSQRNQSAAKKFINSVIKKTKVYNLKPFHLT